MLADIRFAIRSLRKAPGVAAIVTLCMALGIGANTTIFSLTNAVYMRPLPVSEPGRLVRIHSTRQDQRFRSASFLEYRALDDRKDTFEGVAAYRRIRISVGEGDATTMEDAQLVSGNFFRVVGVSPAEGRFFSENEDRVVGEHAVTVLSHKFWTTRFGGDPAIIGRTITLNGRPYQVLGVTPADFLGIEPEQTYQLYVPIMTYAHILGASSEFLTQDWHSFGMLGRLNEGRTIEQAKAVAAATAKQLGADFGGEWQDLRFAVLRGGTLANPEDSGEVKLIFVLLNGVVGVVLLIACANVANILLARAMMRRREIAIRLSLGSGRWRLIRQLLTESLVLGLLGGIAGLTLAYWGADLLRLLRIPENIDTAPDIRVLAYALAVSVLSSVLFGVAPAWQGTRAAVGDTLKQGTRLGLPARSKLRSALVVSQVSLSIVLLVVAGLLLKALVHLRTQEAGYDAQNMIAAELDLTTTGVKDDEGRLIFNQVLERVRNMPGVSSATLSTMVPLAGRQWQAPARSPESAEFAKEAAAITYNVIGSEYFSTLGISVAQGRVLGASDGKGAVPAVVVNRALADRYWPNQNPIGKTLITSDDQPPYTVVGLSEVAQYTQGAGPAQPMMYVSINQQYEPNLTLQVRSSRPSGELSANIRRELQAVRPGLTGTFRTFQDIRTESEFAPRMTATLLSIFGGLALLLAALGLYGVTSFMVAARTHEIGVRLAIGARPSRVLAMVTAHGLRLAGLGALIGVSAGICAGVLISATLAGIRPWDPAVLAAALVTMLGVAFLASVVPARRAAGVDPMIALRAE